MSNFILISDTDEHILTRKKICRKEWEHTVSQAASELYPAILNHCVNQDNLDQWWPGTGVNVGSSASRK